MGNRKEGEQQQQRATVPAFGEWDDMKAAGVLPDYSLDFSKIRTVRMQRKEGGPLTWSSTAADFAAGGVETTAGRLSSSAAADVVDRRDRRRRRHNSDGTDLRRPLRHDRAIPKGRSKLGYLFCCIAG